VATFALIPALMMLFLGMTSIGSSKRLALLSGRCFFWVLAGSEKGRLSLAPQVRRWSSSGRI